MLTRHVQSDVNLLGMFAAAPLRAALRTLWTARLTDFLEGPSCAHATIYPVPIDAESDPQPLRRRRSIRASLDNLDSAAWPLRANARLW